MPHEGALCYVEGSRSAVQHFKLNACDIRIWAEAIAEERATIYSKPRDLLLVPVIRSGSASDHRGLKKGSVFKLLRLLQFLKLFHKAIQ